MTLVPIRQLVRIAYIYIEQEEESNEIHLGAELGVLNKTNNENESDKYYGVLDLVELTAIDTWMTWKLKKRVWDLLAECYKKEKIQCRAYYEISTLIAKSQYLYGDRINPYWDGEKYNPEIKGEILGKYEEQLGHYVRDISYLQEYHKEMLTDFMKIEHFYYFNHVKVCTQNVILQLCRLFAAFVSVLKEKEYGESRIEDLFFWVFTHSVSMFESIEFVNSLLQETEGYPKLRKLLLYTIFTILTGGEGLDNAFSKENTVFIKNVAGLLRDYYSCEEVPVSDILSFFDSKICMVYHIKDAYKKLSLYKMIFCKDILIDLQDDKMQDVFSVLFCDETEEFFVYDEDDAKQEVEYLKRFISGFDAVVSVDFYKLPWKNMLMEYDIELVQIAFDKGLFEDSHFIDTNDLDLIALAFKRGLFLNQNIEPVIEYALYRNNLKVLPYLISMR